VSILLKFIQSDKSVNATRIVKKILRINRWCCFPTVIIPLSYFSYPRGLIANNPIVGAIGFRKVYVLLIFGGGAIISLVKSTTTGEPSFLFLHCQSTNISSRQIASLVLLSAQILYPMLLHFY